MLESVPPRVRPDPRADPRRRRPRRPQDRRSDRRSVRPGLRHQGQGLASSVRRDRSRVARVPGSLLVVDGAVRPRRPGGLCGRQRDLNKWAQQQAVRLPALPGRLVQLGPVGRRHGHGRAQADLREGRAVADPPRRRVRGWSSTPSTAAAGRVVGRRSRSSCWPSTTRQAPAERPAALPSRPRRPAERPTGNSRRSSAARSIWSRCRSWRRTSSTGTPVLPMAIILEWMAEGAAPPQPGAGRVRASTTSGCSRA